MFKKNKQNLESNEDARCLAIINTFIANSRKQLDVLSSLSFENKKKLALDVEDIVRVSTDIMQNRENQIFSTRLEIKKCKDSISTLEKELKDLQASQTKFFKRIKQEHKLYKQIFMFNKKIISLLNSISSYYSEMYTYQIALNICFEFSRRLKFFLEYEENFSS